MADPEQARVLAQGPQAWNEWRDENEGARIDLSGGDFQRKWLVQADLHGAGLSGVNLYKAALGKANFEEANLRGAILNGADLIDADLSGADLSDADLREAYVHGAKFTNAKLRNADLRGIDLTLADLKGADLIGAKVARTKFQSSSSDTIDGVAQPAVRDSIRRLGIADTKDVQQIAAAQLGLLTGYHQIALQQSRRSFLWALVGSGIGLTFFVAATVLAFFNGMGPQAATPLISGAAFEGVSAFVFHLYGQSSSQLSAFHSRLEILQRYMLANSICEGLSEAERDKARAALIGEISRGQPAT